MAKITRYGLIGVFKNENALDRFAKISAYFERRISSRKLHTKRIGKSTRLKSVNNTIEAPDSLSDTSIVFVNIYVKFLTFTRVDIKVSHFPPVSPEERAIPYPL